MHELRPRLNFPFLPKLLERNITAYAVTFFLTICASMSAQSVIAAESNIDQKINALLQKMTIEEKVAQLTVYFALPFLGEEKLNQYAKSAGALLYVNDPVEINRLQRLSLENSRLKIPLMFALDVNHGYSTIFPVPIGLAASWDPNLATRAQSIAASEASAVGIHWTFAPNVDIARDPRWGRMVEGAGEDPYLSSVMAAAQVKGFQGDHIGTPGRIISGPKHFAGYGAAEGGRDYDEVYLSEYELRNIYLPPFKAALDAGAGNIMTAYMALNGTPATADKWLLRDVLRKEWGFEGWVVSDNSSVSGLIRHGVAADPNEAAAQALAAGLDMEMAFGYSEFQHLPEAIKKGRASVKQLDDAVKRILTVKYKLGLFEKPYVDENKTETALRQPENLDTARIAAEKSAVLLKNNNSLLPLDKSKLKSIAVIGALADSPRDALGPWVTLSNGLETQSIIAGIRSKLGDKVDVKYSPGVNIPPRLFPSPLTMMEEPTKRPAPENDQKGISEAIKTANQSDIAILVLGEAHDMIGEIASSSTLNLPGQQQALLDAVVATGKPVVVLLMNGRPLNLQDTKAEAILDIWYPGSRGGDAAANLLFGDATPGGKLPFTWPRNVGQIPIYYSRLPTHDAKNAYKRYWNEPGQPTYPFGYGLSYSTFNYSNLRIDKSEISPTEAVTIKVDLKNTGNRSADEVAQLYIHQKLGSASRPIRELKRFQRVTLATGETRTLEFTLGPADLRYWNSAKRDWVNEASVFEVAIGGDSNAEFQGSFSVVRPH